MNLIIRQCTRAGRYSPDNSPEPMFKEHCYCPCSLRSESEKRATCHHCSPRCHFPPFVFPNIFAAITLAYLLVFPATRTNKSQCTIFKGPSTYDFRKIIIIFDTLPLCLHLVLKYRNRLTQPPSLHIIFLVISNSL